MAALPVPAVLPAHPVEPGQALRVGFAFSAGAATFFAPCAYPLLPGYVAYYLGQSEDGTPGGTPRSVPVRLWRAAVVGSLASLGFFLVYAVLAGIALAVGTRPLQGISVLELVVGALLVVLGVAMATGTFDPTLHARLPERRRSPAGFLLFGVVYAVAAAGCTAPLFVAIVALAFSGGPVGAVLTLGAYAAGMAVLMVAVTVLSALGKAGMVRRLSRDTGRISRVAGVLLAVAGAAQIYLYVFDFDWLGILELV